MRSRRGFTLIELFIAMAIVLVLAAIIYPLLMDVTGDVESVTMAATVRTVRQRIQVHASMGDTPLSTEGYPNQVDPAWFPRLALPRDAWTLRPLFVQVVHGPKTATEPNNKTFNLKPNGLAAGHTAWYNAANGSFCAKVPNRGSEDDMLERFRRVNG